MKVAFDVDVIKELPITDMVRQVSEWGYKYIEQSPHPRINPFYKHPRASREIMTEYKRALQTYGVEISSFIVVYRWSGPDEQRRQAAVKNWKRIIEIAVDMGVQVINTELSGTPDEPEICEEMWYRSMEDLLPVIEREGIRVEIQSHPWDFCELNDETVDMVKSLRSDNVKYLYSAPHTFFYDKGKGDVAEMLRYAGDDLSHVLLADTMNHTLNCRYIVNPPGVNATIHQHLGLGEGEVDFDNLFHSLRELDFANREFRVGGDPIITASLFGYPEKMNVQAVETRERIERELFGR
ncbi:sugar phosphate isomerase/epimerase IolH [Salmonella enterica subsp. enterica serovar Oranienburg]|nr:sugar phosphate isomerase/epimerase IolH [Salmonella enterica subsp. enterica serovar Oranienburg]ECA1474328.1 sugar phosphate isomerase/epimerase IolH [Salmonella enterica subsp. enterica serovar Oranienburg]ECA9000413.1 sugar phosphate isomerase/epimerase IolH [Salmonella enterica subsp. enterica serovar Oranienburg]ECA9347270.1 sugar phosphate isomerase/epimerase IolH [Salmonella enterica subsp. enterica serovar Oranienburg]ECD3079481.1 sugar phosphate isomerase/epimerase IolH [Salmonella